MLLILRVCENYNLRHDLRRGFYIVSKAILFSTVYNFSLFVVLIETVILSGSILRDGYSWLTQSQILVIPADILSERVELGGAIAV